MVVRFTLKNRKTGAANTEITTPSTSADISYDEKKVSPQEFLQITGWIFKFLCSIDLKFTLGFLIFSLLEVMWGVANSYILSLILGRVVSTVQNPGATLSDVYPQFYLLAGVNVAFTVVSFMEVYCRRSLGQVIYSEATRRSYKQLEKLGIQTLEMPEMNNRLQRAREALPMIMEFFSQFVDLFRAILLLTVSFVLLLRVAPVVMIVVAAISIPRFLVDMKFRALSWSWGFKNTENRRRAFWSADELSNTVTLTEILVVKAQKFLDEKYYSFHKMFNDYQLRLQRKWIAFSHLYGLVSDFTTYFGYIYLFGRFISRAISVDQIFFYIRMVGDFQSSLSNSFSRANILFESSLRFRELYLVFNTRETFKDGSVVMERLQTGPEISVSNMHFKYPNSEKEVFKNLTLNIKSGEKVAVVGHNGAGKTTLVKLLCRVYRPTQGKILANGHDINDLNLESWYRNVGVLFQEFNMYPQLSVRDNISIGNPSEPLDEMALRLAAQSADALQFIDEFPNKFDQILSEKFKGGVRPSTGQWQKLAIARFFYRNSPLVIFDEPTASIDAISEYNIFNTIYDFFKGKTVIIISHRFSTVRNADRIVVLDYGEIVEEGSHDSLMNRNGYYAKAFNLQAKGYGHQEENTLPGNDFAFAK